MPEQEAQPVELVPANDISPEALGEFSDGEEFAGILRQLLPEDVVALLDTHFSGPKLWRKLLELFNRIMQYEWFEPDAKMRRMSFHTFGDLARFLSEAKEEQPVKFNHLFLLDADGNKIPRDQFHLLPGYTLLEDTHMRNVFTRRHWAGQLTTFYGLSMDEWRNAMGLELFLDYLQPIGYEHGQLAVSSDSDSAFSGDGEEANA